MASIKISQLNTLGTITSDDFFPVVDSGSMTTFHVPVTAIGGWNGQSGSALSASWASRSIDAYGTASYATNIKGWVNYSRSLSLTAGTAVPMCYLGGYWPAQTYLVSMLVSGYHVYYAKTYLINANYTSPAFSPPWTSASPYAGWFTARPLVETNKYPYDNNAYGDFELEISQSTTGKLSLRIRTSRAHPDMQPTGSLSILNVNGLQGVTSNFVSEVDQAEVVSSEALPAWGSAFAYQHGNYQFIVSGSIQTTHTITASLLFGTSSWAISCSYAQSASNVDSASYALTSISSSYANTASTAGTASWALGFPSGLTGSAAIAGLVPVGSIIDYASSTLSDDNWLICTGSAVSRSSYPALFDIIGTTYGAGDGVDTFNVPDLRKRYTIGHRADAFNQDDSWLSSSVGDTGGGEALNYHWHSAGALSRYNDDGLFYLYGSLYLSASSYPLVTPGGSNYFPYGTWCGECGGSQPKGYVGRTNINWVESSWPIAFTSYGLSKTGVNWYSASTAGEWTTAGSWYTTNRDNHNDLNPPYMVMNKIIRAK